MRKSRVLLAGVAVAAAGAATSAFTAGNTLTAGATADDNVGYSELTATGVTVSNIAYTPVSTDATKLDSVTFTVGEDTTDMNALLTLSGSSGALGGGPLSCTSSTGGAPYLVTCDAADVLIKDITKVALTVVSK